MSNDKFSKNEQAVKIAEKELQGIKSLDFQEAEAISFAGGLLVPTVFDVPLKEPLLVDDNILGEVKTIMGSAMRTAEFDEKYAYDGQLGAIYDPAKTILKLWAPTAVEVELEVYPDTDPASEVAERLAMRETDRGVWELLLPGDHKNLVYTYRLTFANGLVNTACDPYCRAVIANGGRSVVLDPEDVRIDDFHRLPRFSSLLDAVIYELHIRDLSISPDSGITHKGKFLGVVEAGTKFGEFPTGLDYLKSLGITHLQILPMFDYTSVDELHSDNAYNWGYDPLNFNVPEGSYSTDPRDPVKRILELKTMIKQLHEAGIRVIMDVVYNHVFDVKLQNLNLTVPGYFFRYDDQGQLSNGTGVGNDTASERAMMRQFILRSIVYWLTEYHLDGFRFDLMGIHDIDLMNEIRHVVDQTDPSAILLGEGWDLPTPIPGNRKANQKNAYKMPGIAHFNDSMRDLVKGSVFNFEETGFITGRRKLEHLLYLNIIGGGNLPGHLPKYNSPDKIIQYVEAHDNLTMYDKLMKTNPFESMGRTIRRHTLGTAIVLLSQGIPFLHGGQEFLRTKFGDENSYKSPDKINQFDWKRAAQMTQSVDYVKGLIQLRKNHHLFRLQTNLEIRAAVTLLKARRRVVAFELKDGTETLIVMFNASLRMAKVKVPRGIYQVLCQEMQVFEKPTVITLKNGHARVYPLSVSVYKLLPPAAQGE